MSILTPFEYAKYSKPPKEMVGCFFNDYNMTNSTGVGYFRITVVYGLIYGLLLFISSIFTIDLFGSDKTLNLIVQITIPFISLIVIYFCLKAYKNKNGFIDWKTGIIIGGTFGVTYSIMSSSMSYVYFSFINPYALDGLLNNIYQGIENEYMEIYKDSYKQNQLSNLIFSIPIGLVTGAILSLLPTYLLKSK